MKSIVYVGIDVHKATFSACCYVPKNQSYFAEDTFEGNITKVLEYLQMVRDSMEGDIEFHCGYEAGCRGYSLANDIIKSGLDCVIMAPTTIDKPADNAKKKTDRLDARLLARALANGSYKSVHIPDNADLYVKEKIRMLQFHKRELRRYKQAICSLLLRHGKVYDAGKNYWTAKHVAWIKGFYEDSVFGETLKEYMETYGRYLDKIERLEKDVLKLTNDPRYKDTIDRICCLKGIERISALTIIAEINDFNRFESGKIFPAYLGLVPGDHSSGGKTGKLGITKLGNSMLRRLIIECARAAVRKGGLRKSKKLKERQEACDAAVIGYADKGTERMRRRYLHLISEGKNANKAITACAREYCCFIWGLATGKLDDGKHS